MWENIVELGRMQITIRCTRTACWIIKSTTTYSGYVLFIALPLQKWLKERATIDSDFCFIHH